MSKRHRQRRCQLNNAVAVLSNIIKQHGLCKPVRFTRPHMGYHFPKKKQNKNGAYMDYFWVQSCCHYPEERMDASHFVMQHVQN